MDWESFDVRARSDRKPRFAISVTGPLVGWRPMVPRRREIRTSRFRSGPSQHVRAGRGNGKVAKPREEVCLSLPSARKCAAWLLRHGCRVRTVNDSGSGNSNPRSGLRRRSYWGAPGVSSGGAAQGVSTWEVDDRVPGRERLMHNHLASRRIRRRHVVASAVEKGLWVAAVVFRRPSRLGACTSSETPHRPAVLGVTRVAQNAETRHRRPRSIVAACPLRR